MAKSVAKKKSAGKKKAAPASLEDHDRLVLAPEARWLLGFPETKEGARQLRNQVEHGRLEPVRIGKRNHYRLSDIENLIKNGAPSPDRRG